MKYLLSFFFFLSSSIFATTSFTECSGDWLLTDSSTVSVSLSDNAYKVDNGGTFWDCSTSVMYKYSFSNIDTAAYTTDKTSLHYDLYTAGCPVNSSWDNSLQVCVSSCSPLSQYTVNIPQADCSGSFIDTNNQVSGILAYQQCDSTCYVTEAIPLSCEDLLPIYSDSCDRTKFNFSFQCTNVNGIAQIDTVNTFCKPKSNPCDDLYDRVNASCASPKVVIGYPECKHDGLKVLNPEVMQCVDSNSSQNPANQKPWDCTTYFHKTWDESSKSCSCESGYELSFYGSCIKSLDDNASQSEKDKADDDAKNDAQKKEQMELDRNNSLEQNRHLSNIENTLSNISNELNTSNSFLGSIKDLIADFSSKFDDNGSSGVSFDSTQSMNDLKAGYTDVYSSIDEIKLLLANGLVNPIPSGSGGSCAYSNVIEGNGLSIPVTFDPCTVVTPYYSILYNIWYFLFFAAFLVFSIKLLLISKGD
jgi:hypothetical protein